MTDNSFDDGTTTTVPPEKDDLLPPLPERPVIKIIAGQLHYNVDEAERVLQPSVYVQGNMLVRAGNAAELNQAPGDDVPIDRDPNQLALIRVTQEWTQIELTRRVSFQRYSRKAETWLEANCSAEIARLLTRKGSWSFRPLDAIVRAPFMRPDGTICDRAGYDASSRAYHAPSYDFPSVDDSPSLDDAREALGVLLEPFSEFPFKDDSARGTFLAHILTEAARLAIDFSPMFWYTAPDARIGKTLLSEMAATIVHGSRPARRPWAKDGDELRKSLFASLLGGDRSIAFDNMQSDRTYTAPELCAFLTADTWKDRLLGKSEAPTAVNKSVVSTSGNNVRPCGDLAPRSLVCRLDANAPRAQIRSRTFTIEDLREHVKQNRAELLIAALTILRAHHVSKHKGPTTLPGFEKWSRVVRDAVIWIGIADPVDSQKRETDDDSDNVEDAFRLLGARFVDKDFVARDIAEIVGAMADTGGQIATALQQAGCDDPGQSLSVGLWLRGMRDKVAGGYKLIVAGSAKHTNRWQFVDPNADLVGVRT